MDGDRRWPNGNWNAFLERKNGAESECFAVGSFAEHVKNNFELFNYFSIILLILYELHVHIDIVEIQ